MEGGMEGGREGEMDGGREEKGGEGGRGRRESPLFPPHWRVRHCSHSPYTC